MVGYQTALKDNPRLTARACQGRNPLRVVVDRNCSLDTAKNLLDDEAETWIINAEQTKQAGRNYWMQMDLAGNWLPGLLNNLYRQNCLSMIIEGGSTLLDTFIRQNLWDEARIFTGNTCFEGGLKAPVVTGTCLARQFIGSDELKWVQNG